MSEDGFASITELLKVLQTEDSIARASEEVTTSEALKIVINIIFLNQEPIIQETGDIGCSTNDMSKSKKSSVRESDSEKVTETKIACGICDKIFTVRENLLTQLSKPNPTLTLPNSD